MRAVLDVNVLVAGLLSSSGTPAQILRLWANGDCELICSPALVSELERVLKYPRIARYVSDADAHAFVATLNRNSTRADDAPEPTFRTVDPADDYIVNLGASLKAVVVSGDAHVLALADSLPIYTPAEFLALIETGRDSTERRSK